MFEYVMNFFQFIFCIITACTEGWKCARASAACIWAPGRYTRLLVCTIMFRQTSNTVLKLIP